MKSDSRAKRVGSPGTTVAVVRMVLIYAVFAALWILLSDKLVGLVFSDPAHIVIASTLKGWAFVAITSLLLFILMRRLADRLAIHDLYPPGESPFDPLPGWRMAVNGVSGEDVGDGHCADAPTEPLVSIFLLLATLIIASVLGGITHAVSHQKEKEVERLQAIAELKVSQISSWLQERQGDAQFLHSSRFLADLYQRWRDTGDLSSREQLQKRLADYKNIYTYQNVLLLDEQGERVLAVGDAPSPVAPELRATAQRAIAEGRMLSTDLYRSEGPATGIYLDFVAPLPPIEGRPGPALVLRIDPTITLYPMIQSWPFPSPSGETLIFRRDGDQVLFLNNLRHRPDTALKLRIPVAEPRLLAAQALRGEAQLGSAIAVSYTHLDVYKRQAGCSSMIACARLWAIRGPNWL